MAKIVLTDFAFADINLESKIFAQANESFEARKEKSTPAQLAQLVRGADAVMTQFASVNAEVIEAMDQAKVIVRYGIGVDNVDLVAARERGIPVCNVPDYCIDEVADHTLAFILAVTRQVVPNTFLLRSGRWGIATPLESMDALANRTVGVIGFGRIGRAVVRRLVAFNARVLVFDPLVPAEDITLHGALAAASFEALLPECDIVTPHCPSNRQTKKMFNAAAFARMKDGSSFVNVGRGDLVDSDALVSALRSGKLGGAALDVFDPEPIPAGNPVLGMPNVILSGHIASASPRAVRILRETAASIVLKALRGETPPNIVNGVQPRQ
jgi:D-3-phosphoglycerate dehydrogenase